MLGSEHITFHNELFQQQRYFIADRQTRRVGRRDARVDAAPVWMSVSRNI